MDKLTKWAVLIVLVIAGFVFYANYWNHFVQYLTNFDEPKIIDATKYSDGNIQYVCSAPIKLQRVWKNEDYVYQPVISGDADFLCHVADSRYRQKSK